MWSVMINSRSRLFGAYLHLAMSASPPALPPLDGTLGATLIGAVFGQFLFGIETLQTFNYYRNFPKDAKILKVLVAVVWFVELGHSITLWHALYSMIVTFYGQFEHIVNPPHSIEMTVLFSAMINAIVQTFFAFRIRTLSGFWYITALCSLLTAARFAFNMILLVNFWESTSGFEILHTKVRWAMLGVSSLGPSVDIIIATSLCFFLWQIRVSGSQFQQTRRMVDTLIVWSVETTTITSAAGILQLILFLRRSDLAWMTFFLIQPKLFSNSIMAHLNGRERFRNNGTSIQNIASDNYGFESTRRGPQNNSNVVIRMHQMSETTHNDTTDYANDKSMDDHHLKSSRGTAV
ncbi:hypothetical protein C8R43DRAFT_986471 [Mycena crocata]|nr:hypothetical protein C8R43DRAFT_986471 [Mycena crocata]